MSDYKLGEVETRFAELIWENEPLGSGELVKLCAEKLGWKKSTTYTVLRKLCEKGYFRNEDGAVTSLISREGMQAQESRRFVEDSFGGRFPFTTPMSKPTRKEKKHERPVYDCSAAVPFRQHCDGTRAAAPSCL